MRQAVHTVIKKYLRKQISDTRFDKGWTKRTMSEKLAMDERSYSYIEKGESAAVRSHLYYTFSLSYKKKRGFIFCMICVKKSSEIGGTWHENAIFLRGRAEHIS